VSEFYIEVNQRNDDRSDRYRKCKILRDKETNEVLLETRDIKAIPLHANDIYHTVEAHQKCRLDILANIYYGNPLMWWVIAQANNIHDPLKGPLSGDTVRIPSLVSLYGNDGLLL
jgi:hypothetical protein